MHFTSLFATAAVFASLSAASPTNLEVRDQIVERDADAAQTATFHISKFKAAYNPGEETMKLAFDLKSTSSKDIHRLSKVSCAAHKKVETNGKLHAVSGYKCSGNDDLNFWLYRQDEGWMFKISHFLSESSGPVPHYDLAHRLFTKDEVVTHKVKGEVWFQEIQLPNDATSFELAVHTE
jgi:hypothetical protein